jgi:hypothetical protein
MLSLQTNNNIDYYAADGHWWPESYYLGSIQARQALYDVCVKFYQLLHLPNSFFQILAEVVQLHELAETEAVAIVQNALFHNANRLYKLGLEPHLPPSS